MATAKALTVEIRAEAVGFVEEMIAFVFARGGQMKAIISDDGCNSGRAELRVHDGVVDCLEPLL